MSLPRRRHAHVVGALRSSLGPHKARLPGVTIGVSSAPPLAVEVFPQADPLERLAALPGAFALRSSLPDPGAPARRARDRKSTRLNSSHLGISYAVFCLKKKNKDRYLRSMA